MRIHVWDANGAPIAPGGGGGGGSPDFLFSHFVGVGGEASVPFSPPNAPFYELLIAARVDVTDNVDESILIQFNDDDGGNYYIVNITKDQEDPIGDVAGGGYDGILIADAAATSQPDIGTSSITRVTIQNVIANGLRRSALYGVFTASNVEDTPAAGFRSGGGEWQNTDLITSITIKPVTEGALFVEGSLFILRSIGA